MVPTSPSLLERLNDADAVAWQRLTSVYSPLVRGWLRRHGIRPDDADDLTQEVLVVVVRRYPDFRHNQRTGAFRAWLRAITVNCCRDFWKANRLRPAAPGGSDFGGYLDQIADPSNPLAAEWDREHDLFVTRQLLGMIRPEFEAKTWEAFRRVAVAGEPAAAVAAALGVSTNVVFIAKSRVLSRLREEAAGLVE
ncbi:MAG: RNA polymerase sigma factor [Fimbriiglobus sp.]